MTIRLAALRERVDGERRVAITPEVAEKLGKLGAQVLLEPEAGQEAGFPDQEYHDVSWQEADELLAHTDVLLCVQPPPEDLVEKLDAGTVLIGQLQPHADQIRLSAWAEQGLTAFAMELLPRTTRAQAMDVLSSQAAVAGYRAMLIAAEAAPRFFPMLTTAAGTIRPASVLVIGAGVAGLQAIATARRLGAQVEGYDVRPETAEQVRSLGARFLELGVAAAGSGGYARELDENEKKAQAEALAGHLRKMDVVVTTAAVPGRRAPTIVSAEMVAGMRPGSLIVDLAAQSGGNCEVTEPGERVCHHGVEVIGPLDLAAGAATSASAMYSRNLLSFVGLLLEGDQLTIDFDDELLDATCVCRDGTVRFPRK